MPDLVLNDEIIKRVDKTKYLGINIDESLISSIDGFCLHLIVTLLFIAPFPFASSDIAISNFQAMFCTLVVNISVAPYCQ